MTNFYAEVHRVAGLYDVPNSLLCAVAEAHIQLEHPEALDEVDALPSRSADRIDGLLDVIECEGSTAAFLDYLDLRFNPQHA